MPADDELARLLASRGWLSPEAWEAWQRARAAGQAADLASFLRATQLTDPALLDAALRELADAGLRSSLVSASGDSTLGRYELLRELGRGGFGVVYLGRSPDGREVAIKVLLDADDEAVSRFDREARVLKSLSEEGGFVPLEDWGHSQRGPYLVMPYISGGSLAERLSKEGPLEVEEGVGLIAEVSRDIGRAHEQGVIHRDIKPANILFNEAGQPLLTDLGLARRFGQAPGMRSVSLSVTGQAMGTPGYMAPEQMLDAKGVGPEADVYGLAATLYKALTGARPYEAESLMEMMGLQARGALRPLADFGIAAPGLELVLARALSPEPTERPNDGQALAEALEALLDEAPPRRAPVALLGLGLLLVGAAVAWAALPARLPPSLGPGGVIMEEHPPSEPADEAPTPPQAAPAPAGPIAITEVITGGVGRARNPTTRLALSPDGAWLASTAVEPMLRVWDARTLAPRFAISCAPSQHLWSVAWAPDGESLFVGGNDGIVTHVDSRDGAVLGRLGPLMGRPVTALACTPAGLLIAGTGKDCLAWELDELRPARVPEALAEGASLLRLDGDVLYAGLRERVMRLDATSGARLQSWDLSGLDMRGLSSVCPVDEGRRLLVASSGAIALIPVEGGEPAVIVPRPPPVKSHAIYDVQPLGGARFGFVKGDEVLRVWDWEQRREVEAWTWTEDLHGLLALSPERLITGSRTGLLQLGAAAPPAPVIAHRADICELRIDATGLITSLDAQGRLIEQRDPPRLVFELGEALATWALSEDGQRLFISGATRAALVDLETGRSRPAPARKGLQAACWCGDKVVLLGERILVIFDSQTGASEVTTVHSKGVSGLSGVSADAAAMILGDTFVMRDITERGFDPIVPPGPLGRLVELPGPAIGVLSPKRAELWERRDAGLEVLFSRELPGAASALGASRAGDVAVALGRRLWVKPARSDVELELDGPDASDRLSCLRFVPGGLLAGTARGLILRVRVDEALLGAEDR